MFGRFELLDRIGIGGMAEVWRARVAGVGGFEKILVVKKILPAFAQNKTFIEMLLAEARLCAVLQHANIVQTYENGEIDGNYYIAMEYVSGPDLFKVLSRSTQVQMRIPTEMCLFIAAEVAKGLHYAHNAKDHYGRPLHIIHRDVSPSNIIVSEAGEVKVMDFGVARATPGGQPSDNATRSGVLKGKLGYMSPEQVTGQPFDHRSDIFSLGIILYESLTLKRLFLAKTDLETLVNIRDARLEHKFKKHAYIDENVRDVLRRALARDVNERYPTAMAMHDDIMTLLFQQKIQVSNNALANFVTKLFDPALQVIAQPNLQPGSPPNGQQPPITRPQRVLTPDQTPSDPRHQPQFVPASQMVTAQAKTGVDAPAFVPSSVSLSFSADDMKRIRERIAEKRAAIRSGDVLSDLDDVRLPPVPEMAALERRREPEPPTPASKPVERASLRETMPAIPKTQPRPAEGISAPADGGETRTMHSVVDELRAQTAHRDVPSAIDLAIGGTPEPASYKVASSRNVTRTVLYRVRAQDGNEYGPIGQDELEGMLRARTATVSDLVSVNEGPYQPISTVPSLEVMVASAMATLGAPKVQGPLTQWMFVRLVYRMYADRATGCLELRRGESVKSIFFRRGRTQYIASNQHNELLGPFMVQNGFISQSDIDMAMQRARETGGRLGDLLIGLNLIKPFQLYQVLERQLRAKFIDAFAWEGGTFAYYEDAAPPSDIVPLDIDTVTVLADGVRERIPLSVLEPMVADKLDRPLYRSKNALIGVGSLKLSARETKALSSLLAAPTPRTAYDETYNNRQQRLAFLHVLTLMLQTDLMTFDPERAAQ